MSKRKNPCCDVGITDIEKKTFFIHVDDELLATYTASNDEVQWHKSCPCHLLSYISDIIAGISNRQKQKMETE
jgi:hypothetical protein